MEVLPHAVPNECGARNFHWNVSVPDLSKPAFLVEVLCKHTHWLYFLNPRNRVLFPHKVFQSTVHSKSWEFVKNPFKEMNINFAPKSNYEEYIYFFLSKKWGMRTFSSGVAILWHLCNFPSTIIFWKVYRPNKIRNMYTFNIKIISWIKFKAHSKNRFCSFKEWNC